MRRDGCFEDHRLSSRLVFGIPSTPPKKTLLLSSNLHKLIFSAPSLPPALLRNSGEHGRCLGGDRDVSVYLFIPISLELSQTVSMLHGEKKKRRSKTVRDEEKCGDEGHGGGSMLKQRKTTRKSLMLDRRLRRKELSSNQRESPWRMHIH